MDLNEMLRTMIVKAMQLKGVTSYTELAKRAGSYRQIIRNKIHKKYLTVPDVVELFEALGYEIQIKVIDKATGNPLY